VPCVVVIVGMRNPCRYRARLPVSRTQAGGCSGARFQ
jgi:hypothetical protein